MDVREHTFSLLIISYFIAFGVILGGSLMVDLVHFLSENQLSLTLINSPKI